MLSLVKSVNFSVLEQKTHPLVGLRVGGRELKYFSLSTNQNLEKRREGRIWQECTYVATQTSHKQV